MNAVSKAICPGAEVPENRDSGITNPHIISTGENDNLLLAIPIQVAMGKPYPLEKNLQIYVPLFESGCLGVPMLRQTTPEIPRDRPCRPRPHRMAGARRCRRLTDALHGQWPKCAVGDLPSPPTDWENAGRKLKRRKSKVKVRTIRVLRRK